MQDLGKYKNLLAMLGVIVIAFFVIRSIYDYHAAILTNLEKQRREIKQLSTLIQTWKDLDLSISRLKYANTHKDEADLKQFVEYCAQTRHVNITKLSPGKEDKKIYQIAKIDLTITIPSYSSLVGFIRELELKKVSVSRMRIQKTYQQQTDQRVVDLSLTAYLPKTEETK
jgi:hypothetical protein